VPRVRELTGQASGWLSQKPRPNGHLLPSVMVMLTELEHMLESQPSSTVSVTLHCWSELLHTSPLKVSIGVGLVGSSGVRFSEGVVRGWVKRPPSGSDEPVPSSWTWFGPTGVALIV